MGCDVSDPASVEAAVAEAMEAVGHVDVLVNSAGIVDLAPAEDLSAGAWNRTLAVNLSGTFFMSQAVGRHMLAAGRGKIINLASQAASVGLLEHAAYCASKAGVVGLTKVLATEWAGRGVTANTISPTVVLTELGKKAWAGEKGEAAKREIPVGPVRAATRGGGSGTVPGQRRLGHDQRRRPRGRRRLHDPLTRVGLLGTPSARCTRSPCSGRLTGIERYELGGCRRRPRVPTCAGAGGRWCRGVGADLDEVEGLVGVPEGVVLVGPRSASADEEVVDDRAVGDLAHQLVRGVPDTEAGARRAAADAVGDEAGHDVGEGDDHVGEQAGARPPGHLLGRRPQRLLGHPPVGDRRPEGGQVGGEQLTAWSRPR